MQIFFAEEESIRISSTCIAVCMIFLERLGERWTNNSNRMAENKRGSK